MQQRLQSILNGVLERWNNLERNQKVKLVITALAFVISLGVVMFMLTRPKMVTIYNNNLDWDSAGKIRSALANEGIQSRIIDGGRSIEVNEKDADNALVKLSTENVAGTDEFTFATAFTYMGMGTTESVKKVVLRREAEARIAAQLKNFPGVEYASVNIAMPEDSKFLQPTQKTTASATITSNREFSRSEATALARFICKSVVGLELENVEILNQNFESIYTGQTEENGAHSSQYDLEILRKKEFTATLKNMLNPLYDDVRIIVNMPLNWQVYNKQTEEYTTPQQDTSTGYVGEETTEKRTVTNGSSDQEPGIGSNDATSPGYEIGNGSTSNASENKKSSSYIYDKSVTVVEGAVGEVNYERTSAMITVYRYRTYDEQYMRDNRLLGDVSWDDFKRDNENAVPIIIDANFAESIRVGVGISSLSMEGFEIPIFVDRIVQPFKWEELVMFAICALLILLLVYGFIRKTQPDEITEIEPELSVEDLLVSTQYEEEKEEEEKRLRDIGFSKDSEAKKQIEKFINEKPESAAQLLRNWLNDEWGE